MTEKEYISAKAQLLAYTDASEKWMTENKTRGIPGDVREQFPFADVVTNELRSQIEVYEFMHEKPEKYFAYVNGVSGQLTTWTGEPLGTVSWWGTEWRSNMGDARQAITVNAINGVKYFGTFYKGAGDYARLKASKV